MKLALQAILFFLSILHLGAQENNNLELLANVPVGEDGNDIWGYVDADGTEYAVMGSLTATRIFSLEDPSNPISRAVIPGARSIWRDIKSYKNHLYVTTDDFNANAGETGDGLTIIDMTNAPDSITFTRWQPFVNFDGITGQLGECHNIYIDTTDGFAYLAGCQNVGREGVIILDLNEDPNEPVIVGIQNNRYAHDVFVLEDRMYTSDIIAGFLSVYDISDKANPVEQGRASTTSFFTHNAWSSDDNHYVFTTDERPRGRVDAYDVSDLNNITRLDDYIPVDRFADNAIPHNTHYLDGYLVTSWYTEGLVVLDAHEPDNLVKIASYDTYTSEATIPPAQANRWFFGLWGAYPYLPSGLMLGSDINSGLYVWKPVQETNGSMADGFVRASYLQGTVTDANNGNTITGASVKILSDDANDALTQGMGVYKTGQISEGTFMVEFSHPNYDPVTLEATLEAGVVTVLDAQLNSTELFIRSVRADNGELIPFTRIILENTISGFKTTLLTNDDGTLRTSVRSGELYKILAARWDYKGTETSEFLAQEALSFDIELESGYEDDFFADLGWEVNSTAETGAWQRGIPDALTFNGASSQLSMDLPFDLGDECYATGLRGDNAGSNDIDDGSTTVTSRNMDWTQYEGAKVSYHLFFANGGGQGNPPLDDSLFVTLSNGVETINLQGIQGNTFEWTDSIITVLRPTDIEFTDQMTIAFTAGDEGEGHIAEAQLDGFNVDQLTFVSTEEVSQEKFCTIYPNPVSNILQISRGDDNSGTITYEVYSADGRLVNKGGDQSQLIYLNTDSWTGQGLYYLHIINTEGNTQVEKVVKL